MKIVKIKIQHALRNYVKLIDKILKETCLDYTKLEFEVNCFNAPHISSDSMYDELREAICNTFSNREDSEFPIKQKHILVLEIDALAVKSVADNDDAFITQYLMMLRKIIIDNMLRLNIERVITVFSYSHIQKLSSLLFFDYFQFFISPQKYKNFILSYNYGNGTFGSFPTKFALSTEWLPIIPIDLKRNPTSLVEILSKPLFSKDEVVPFIKNILNNQKIETKKDWKTIIKKDNDLSQNYIGVLKTIVEILIKKAITNSVSCRKYFERMSNDDKIIIFTAQSLALIIFMISFTKISWGDLCKKSIEDQDKSILEVFHQCYDYAEILIQLAENAGFYSDGGYLTIRANDDSDSVKHLYNIPKPDSSVRKTTRIIRFSVIDYINPNNNSLKNKLMLESIRKKSGITDLAMQTIFDADGLDENQSKQYKNYLKSEENVIHHYGLPTFCRLVSKHGGLFTVISSAKSNLDEHSAIDKDEYVIKYNKNGYGIQPSSSNTKYLSPHICGTHYDIVLPIFLNDVQVSAPPTVSFDNNSNDETFRVEEQLINFFDAENIKKIIINSDRGNNSGEWKQNSVANISKQLEQKIKKLNNGNVIFTFNLEKSNFDIRFEIIAKVIMSTIIHLRGKSIYFALTGVSEPQLVKFLRQFALFYDKTGYNEYMKGAQIFVFAEDGKTNAFVGGASISSIYEQSFHIKLNSGVSQRLLDFFKHISIKVKVNDEQSQSDLYKLVPFEDYIKIKNKYSWEYRLEEILNTEITEQNKLGCKISDMHVAIGNDIVHLNRFYEAQILFGNAYWYKKFAIYLADKIATDLQTKVKKSIVLIGYEVYSEAMLFSLKELLTTKNYNVEYIIYEKGKYITRDIKGQDKLRCYFDLSNQKDSYFVFIAGISTTLSTFYEMLGSLEKELNKDSDLEEIVEYESFYYSIIQIVGDSLGYDREIINIENRSVKNTLSFINFFTNKNKIKSSNVIENGINANYLISAKADWYNPHDKKCDLCFPNNFLEERPITKVNETSLIPIQMLETVPDPEKLDNHYSEFELINDLSNKKYLSYGHMHRGDNHYQYYFHTANLLRDQLEDINSDIYNWFKTVRNELKSTKDGNKDCKSINIIITSAHFSNQTFVAAINQYVFNNQAYLINFDVKKEFRRNFELKYGNYIEIINILNEIKDSKTNYNINCYFVDDEIISGRTYHRAKDLVSRLLDNTLQEQCVKINIFNAVIVFVDRSSSKTRMYYAENGKFFAYLRLNIPSIRSYGDSCPICKKKHDAKEYISKSILNSMDYYWRKKTIYHSVKTIDDRGDHKNVSDKIQTRNFRRLQCESRLYSIISCTQPDELYNTILQKIYEDVNLCRDDDKIECLISYLKVLSRPFLSYRKNIKSIMLNIFLTIFDIITCKLTSDAYSDKYEHNTLFGAIEKFLSENKYSSQLSALYGVIITGLCEASSNFLVSNPQILPQCIKACRNLQLNDSEINVLDILKKSLKIYSCAGSAYADRLNNILETLLYEQNHYDGEHEIYYEFYIETTEVENLILDSSQTSESSHQTSEMYKGIIDKIKSTITNSDGQLSRIITSTIINLYVSNIEREGTSSSLKLVDIYSDDDFDNDLIRQKSSIEQDYLIGQKDLLIYELNDSGRIFWLKIDNNYSKFKDKESESMYKTEFPDERETCSMYIALKFNSGSFFQQLKTVKRFAAFRKTFLKILNDDFNNDAVKLSIETENKSKALSMSKASQHGSIQQIHNECCLKFESLIDKNIISYKSNDLDENAEENNLANLLRVDIIHLLTNEFISLLYRKIVANKINKILRIDDTNMIKEVFDTHKIDTDINGEYKLTYNHISGTSKNMTSHKISLNFHFCSDNKYILSLFDDELSHIGNPLEICLFICILNRLKHKASLEHESKFPLQFDIKAEGNYLVISNNGGVNNDDIKNAKECIQIAPWRRLDDNSKGDNPAITLWSLGKYCELVKQKYIEKINESMSADVDIKQINDAPSISVSEEDGKFTLKLWMMCDHHIKI